MIGIYKITNPNGKIYIGQSVDIEKRWEAHKNIHKNGKYKWPLYNSFAKYGFDEHTFEVIEECKVNELNERERYYQEKYNVIEDGLNCVVTGYKNKSGYIPENIRKKISNSLLGRKRKEFSQEWKDNISKAVKGRVLTESHKRKIGAAHKGRQDMFGKNNGMYGKHHSSETKIKIGKAVSEAWSKKGKNIIRHNSKPVTINGIRYVSILQASKKTGISEYKISKYYM